MSKSSELISQAKIEEWIQEVEQRPLSAGLLIRFLAGRLRDLTARNEELLDENIALRSGRRVEEYERRIANLEYQLSLLRRQFGESAEAALAGAELNRALGVADSPRQKVADSAISVIIYTPRGQLLNLVVPRAGLVSGATVGSFPVETFRGANPENLALRMLATAAQEELLLVFDSGRGVAVSLEQVPPVSAQPLDWKEAYLQEPLGKEALALVTPFARLALFDHVVQVSRRGFVKRTPAEPFESAIARNYVGTGVVRKADEMCDLVLCHKDDRFLLATYEGFLTALEINRLPLAVEETLKLGLSDHIVSGFPQARKTSLLVVTQLGKIIHREVVWVETAVSNKSPGQPVYSKERRAAGVRVVSAAAVDNADWGVALRSDGQLIAYQMADLFNSGALLEAPQPGAAPLEILAFAVVN